MVAMYFLSLVLVIFVGFDRGGSHSVANFLRQSHPRKCSSDCLFGLANTYGFLSGIPTARLVLLRRSMLFFTSGVKITGTFLSLHESQPCLICLKKMIKNTNEVYKFYKEMP